MATDKKITQMTAIDAVSDGDYFAVVDDPTGTPVTKRCTRTQIVATCEKSANKDAANGYAGLNANGDVPLSHLFPASAASVLLGRGSAGGAGDFQEITLGSGLSMTAQVLAATATGGGAAWTLVYDQALSALQTFDFLSLGSYNEILIVGRNVAKGSAVTQILVSTNNGSSWLSSSGDYVSVANGGIGANDTSMSCSGNNASTHQLIRHISLFNTTAPKVSMLWSDIGSNATYLIPSTSALNAIRLQTHQNTFTSGQVKVYGRS